MNTNSCNADAATGVSNLADEIVDKKGFGQHWRHSVRSVDNWLEMGLPHFKIGKRRVRISVREADAWMRQRFGQERHGRVRKPATVSTGRGV